MGWLVCRVHVEQLELRPVDILQSIRAGTQYHGSSAGRLTRDRLPRACAAELLLHFGVVQRVLEDRLAVDVRRVTFFPDPTGETG